MPLCGLISQKINYQVDGLFYFYRVQFASLSELYLMTTSQEVWQSSLREPDWHGQSEMRGRPEAGTVHYGKQLGE